MDPNSVIVISDASIKNNVATSISHVHLHSNGVKNTIYHAVNITSTEAKLFAIRYGINQAVQILDIFYIIVITNTIHSVRHIFDSMTHPYQIQLIAIVQDFREFFNKHAHTSIDFGIVQATPNSSITHQLINIQKNSTLLLSSYVKSYGISAKKKNAMTLSQTRHLTSKRIIF